MSHSVSHSSRMGKVIRICLANRWMSHDPFLSHRNKIKMVDRVILTPDELQKLRDKEFCLERLRTVRDVFLFCCYTGLSFIDAQQLTKSEIKIWKSYFATWINYWKNKNSLTHQEKESVLNRIVFSCGIY